MATVRVNKEVKISERNILANLKDREKLMRKFAELKDEIANIDNGIKAFMESKEIEDMNVGGYKVSYKTITSHRLDTAKLKSLYPEAYKESLKLSASKRFTVK